MKECSCCGNLTLIEDLDQYGMCEYCIMSVWELEDE